MPGWFLLSTALGVLGAAAGRWNPKAPRLPSGGSRPNWTAALAWITCAAVLLLIAAGGLVTGFRAGMAVPDWPNTFGSNMFLYPLALMTGGVFYEHFHRLLGTLAGSAAFALAIHLTVVLPPRKGLVACTWVAGIAVAIQGVFGGFRVVDDSHCLAVVHGFFAHAILGGLVAIAVMLRRSVVEETPDSLAGGLARRAAECNSVLATAAVIVILLQTLLGTFVRQLNLGLLAHVTLAAVVALCAVGAGVSACSTTQPPKAPPLRWGGLALMLLVVVQLGLGIVAVAFRTPSVAASPTADALAATGGRLPVDPLPALVTTAHQVTAAVLLGLATAVAVGLGRIGKLAPPARSKSIHAA
ncbi:MAG: COX15/CtaA family protein [Thermoguttaceae bacterium]